MVETFKYLDAYGRKAFGQTFINDSSKHLHHINNMIITTFQTSFICVNTETLKWSEHDTEEQALNHILDYYKNLNTKQLSFE